MDFFEVIAGRRSIRRYAASPVPDADIRRILDAGRLAPSANNAQPWSFVVIQNKPLLLRMADAVREQVDRMIPFAENQAQAQRLNAYKSSYYTFFEHAPVVIAAFLEMYDRSTDRLLERMGYGPEEVLRLRPDPGLQSIAAAIEHVVLAAHVLGYGCCWMTGPLIAQEAFERMLGYGKEKAIAALLPLGVPAEAPLARPRKTLGDISKALL